MTCGVAPTSEYLDFAGLKRAGTLAERICVEQQLPTANQQILALPRKPHASSDSARTAANPIRFKRLDLPRRGRLGQIQPHSRACKTGAVSDRDEGAQKIAGSSAHMIIYHR